MTDFSDIKGVVVWSPGGSIYGTFVAYEPPSTYFKVPHIYLAEIVKAQTPSGWKFKNKKLSDAQKEKGYINKRVYISQDMIGGVLEAINRILSENMGETGPDVDEKFQYNKFKTDRAVDQAVSDFGEFGGSDTPSEGSDESVPF